MDAMEQRLNAAEQAIAHVRSEGSHLDAEIKALRQRIIDATLLPQDRSSPGFTG